MTSIVRTVLGEDFAELHPKVQWRFGFDASDEVAQFGTGVMTSVSHSRLLPPPALWLAGRRSLAPSKSGADVPFTIANYAYVDELGRETVAFVRRFQFPGKEISLDSVMVLGADGSALDYIGAGPDMVTRTDCLADTGGGLSMRSDVPKFLLPRGSLKIPGFASAYTYAREWWDGDAECHRIEIEVRGGLLGTLFHYAGWFTAVQRPCPAGDRPAGLGPSRVEAREY